MRGRVMAIFLAIALGGTPLGAPHRRLGRRHVRAALGAGRRRGGRLAAALVGLRYVRSQREVESANSHFDSGA